jgi:formate-dependent phosphoribosylglycinamide formyltransferase (GAR transformylase)
MKIPALILTLSVLLLITTLNIANASSNPIPFLPPIQHSQSQSQPSEHLQPQQQMSQTVHNQPLHTNAHNNQFDNHSPSVTSVMPF